MRILFTGLNPTAFLSLGTIVHRPALTFVSDPGAWRRVPQILDHMRQGIFDRIVITSYQGGTLLHDLGATWPRRQQLVVDSLRTMRELRAPARIATGFGRSGLLEALGPIIPGERILLVPGSHAPGGLQQDLINSGAQITRLQPDRLVPNPSLPQQLPPHDASYFVSPRGVRHAIDFYGAGAFKQAWGLGAAVVDELHRHGLTARRVVPRNRHTGDSL